MSSLSKFGYRLSQVIVNKYSSFVIRLAVSRRIDVTRKTTSKDIKIKIQDIMSKGIMTRTQSGMALQRR